MIERLVREQRRGRGLVTPIPVALGIALLIALLGETAGANQLIGLHGALGVFVAIAAGPTGGAWAGLVVGGAGAAMFVVLIGYGQPPDPYLFGIPVIMLWRSGRTTGRIERGLRGRGTVTWEILRPKAYRLAGHSDTRPGNRAPACAA
jgi:hypothetical protein